MRRVHLFFKRAFDIVASAAALLLLWPLFLVVAAIIKLTSSGPVFFAQERLGKDGKPFKILKFRTMVVNAEYMGEGLRVSSEHDPRITWIGRILRKTSVDEFPNLINTLMGTMSLVGPRPPVTYHPYSGYEGYPERAKKRFEMRPGITGLAQATVRNSATWDERIEIDNQYIEEFTFWMDIKILFMTVFRVLKRKNIYGTSAGMHEAEQEQKSEMAGK